MPWIWNFTNKSKVVCIWYLIILHLKCTLYKNIEITSILIHMNYYLENPILSYFINKLSGFCKFPHFFFFLFDSLKIYPHTKDSKFAYLQHLQKESGYLTFKQLQCYNIQQKSMQKQSVWKLSSSRNLLLSFPLEKNNMLMIYYHHSHYSYYNWRVSNFLLPQNETKQHSTVWFSRDIFTDKFNMEKFKNTIIQTINVYSDTTAPVQRERKNTPLKTQSRHATRRAILHQNAKPFTSLS